MPWVVGVDIGGTFTDVAAIELESGEHVVQKTITASSDPLGAIIPGLVSAGVLETTSDFVHGTTLATNALVQRTGAAVGVLTTEGFEDVLEIGRGSRYDMYDLQLQQEVPLVPSQRRRPITERMSAHGDVLTPLSESSARRSIAELKECGVEAIAICLLHSHRNNTHELQLCDMLSAEYGHVTMSSDVAPIVREYDRFLLAVVNAYVAPPVSAYLNVLTGTLAASGYRGAVRIMKSDGGWCDPAAAAAHPVRLLESGPVAGAIAAGFVARECGAKIALAFDMGGTTAKACLVFDGAPLVGSEIEFARREPMVAGSGISLKLPCVDVLEIGAGGGSIATRDSLGLVSVGPASAGAFPGPACYRNGGVSPTVTDADLALGYLDPSSFAGGAMRLDLAAAAEAISTLVGDGLSDVTEAAWAIHEIVNDAMASAARTHCVEHGVDPRETTIVATGGAGPLHAAGVAALIGSRRALVPPDGGVASAFGLILAPRVEEITRTVSLELDALVDGEVAARLDDLERRIRESDDWPTHTQINRLLGMRLARQGYELRVPLVSDLVTPQALREAFRAEHQRRFGRAPADRHAIQIVSLTVRFSAARSLRRARTVLSDDRQLSAPRSTRAAFFGTQHGWLDTPVYARSALASGWQMQGPALIEEATSTVVVTPKSAVAIDEFLNLHLVLQ